MRKRALTLILALTMLLALALPARAAGEPEIIWFDGEYGSEVIDGSYGEGLTEPWAKAGPDKLNVLDRDSYIFNASNNSVINVSEEENISSPDFDDILLRGEGPYRVSKTTGNGDTVYGYADRTGKVVIPLTYGYAGPFYEGTAVVWKEDENSARTYYLIDAAGKVVKTLDYDFVDEYSGGFYPVTKNRKFVSPLYGLIDAAGNLAYNLNENSLRWTFYLGNGLFSFSKDVEFNTYEGAINTKGQIVIPADYDHLFTTHGLINAQSIMETKDGWSYSQALYDPYGNLLIPSGPYNYELISGGYNASRNNGKWSLTELSTGKTVIADSDYRPFDSGWGLIAGYIEGKAFDATFTPAETFCVWDSSGQVVIDNLDNVRLSGRYVFVARGKKVGYFINPCYKNERTDTMLDIDSWAAPGIDWALSNGYALSLTPIYFGANTRSPRWEVVSVIWRAMGSPEPKTTTCPFTDVTDADDYYKAVLWAYENKIAAGITSTTFGPNEPVNRAQAVTFIHRAAGLPAASGSNPFADVAAGEYYTDAVIWAAENAIAAGKAAATFDPFGPVTRAEILAFLYRWKNK